jgi:hypothetical protein
MAAASQLFFGARSDIDELGGIGVWPDAGNVFANGTRLRRRDLTSGFEVPQEVVNL